MQYILYIKYLYYLCLFQILIDNRHINIWFIHFMYILFLYFEVDHVCGLVYFHFLKNWINLSKTKKKLTFSLQYFCFLQEKSTFDGYLTSKKNKLTYETH